MSSLLRCLAFSLHRIANFYAGRRPRLRERVLQVGGRRWRPNDPVGCGLVSQSAEESAPEAVSIHNAYRFNTYGEPHIEGTVYKVRPRYIIWEATVDGTAIKARAETRGEAIEEAVRQARVALAQG